MDAILFIKAALMGIVEGLTEFLPISSTGHLILAGSLLGFVDAKAKVFEIAIQTGAIFAVIWVYWHKVWGTVVGLPSSRTARRFVLNIAIAFTPAVALGLAFGSLVKAHLFTPWVVATTFILGGFVILWAEKRAVTLGIETGINTGTDKGADAGADAGADSGTGRIPVVRIQTVDDMSPLDALKVGLVQCLALVPGTSRSGATIIGGMLMGLPRAVATEFSFFLAMPTLIGAGAYSLYKDRALLSAADIPLFSVGLVFSFLSAWVCVRWLLRYVASHSFVPFAWYRIGFGCVVLLTASLGWVKWA